MQASENGQLNLDYAQEWITFLKRRNLVLGIIWPILLILVISLSLAAFYFYQLDQTSKLNLAIETDKNLSLVATVEQLNLEKLELTSSNTDLSTELESLKSAREELSVLNNDSNSKLNITSQMVDNLNQLVSELKNEREDLSVKLEDSLETITQLQNQHQAFIKLSNKEKTDSVTELNKQIDSRKSAYQALANRQQEMREEMDRLSNLANTKEKQIEKLNKENQTINSRLNDKNNEIESYKNKVSILEKNNSELEIKLNALVSPISNSSTMKPNLMTPSLNQTEASKKITGLEEIKKPAVQNKTKLENTNQAFDHNQISILP